MIKFTTPDGKHVWIAKSWVQAFRHPVPHEYPSINVGTILILSGINQGVREVPEEVARRLGANTDAKE